MYVYFFLSFFLVFPISLLAILASLLGFYLSFCLLLQWCAISAKKFGIIQNKC